MVVQNNAIHNTNNIHVFKTSAQGSLVGLPVVQASVEQCNRTIFWQLLSSAMNVYHNITGIYEPWLALLQTAVFKTEEMIVYKHDKVHWTYHGKNISEIKSMVNCQKLGQRKIVVTV
jgi:hypothetical protein